MCVRLDDLDVKPCAEALRIQQHEPTALVPIRATEGSAGYDLFASNDVVIKAGDQALVPTGVALDIPEGHYGQIKPRSGLALKRHITVDAGVIN